MSVQQLHNEAPDPVIQKTTTTIITETQADAPIVPDTLQHIYTMYAAINDGSYAPADYFDSYMQTSDLVKMYFTSKRLTALRAAID